MGSFSYECRPQIQLDGVSPPRDSAFAKGQVRAFVDHQALSDSQPCEKSCGPI
jgi:hypothetical protein